MMDQTPHETPRIQAEAQSTARHISNNQKSTVAYVFSGLAFIPLIGVLFGLFAIVMGATKKTKGPIILGVLGILFTVTIYGNLWYWGTVAKSGPFSELKIKLVEQVMDDDAGRIILFERRTGALPQIWNDLGQPSPDNAFYSIDPWGTEMRLTPRQNGTFELRSAGPDRLFDSEDDISKTY